MGVNYSESGVDIAVENWADGVVTVENWADGVVVRLAVRVQLVCRRQFVVTSGWGLLVLALQLRLVWRWR